MNAWSMFLGFLTPYWRYWREKDLKLIIRARRLFRYMLFGIRKLIAPGETFRGKSDPDLGTPAGADERAPNFDIQFLLLQVEVDKVLQDKYLLYISGETNECSTEFHNLTSGKSLILEENPGYFGGANSKLIGLWIILASWIRRYEGWIPHECAMRCSSSLQILNQFNSRPVVLGRKDCVSLLRLTRGIKISLATTSSLSLNVLLLSAKWAVMTAE